MQPGSWTRRTLLRRTLGGVVVMTGGVGRGADKKPLPASARIAAALEYATKTRGLALLVRQRGKVLHESYTNGARRGEVRRIYSGTKAFWSLAALAAVEDGLLELDKPVAEVITEWKGTMGKDRVSLRQLLDFSAGLERGLKIHEDDIANRNALALSRPLVAQPGKAFIYGPSCLQVVHEMLKRKLAAKRRKESPTRYLERRVLGPLDLGPQRYLPDAAGNPLLAAGFVMTPHQWARIGELVLRKGKPVLEERDSFAQLTKGSTANGAYAFGFWNNLTVAAERPREVNVESMLDKDWAAQSWDRACLCTEAPAELVACIGSGGNRLFVVPALELIVVRQAQNSTMDDGRFLRLLLGTS